ncbi:MAG TPA: hypothetical protein VLS28_02545 [Candidatus Sulfomarinibacteraceae bacterium]|nr:hypothetical protein [Candidatus Sulfomarinibacteraceae bacterium]
MDAVARWAGMLAIAGGALTVILVGIVAYDPNTDAWFGFFLVVALLGLAVLGLEMRTRTATGQLGRVSAWCSIVGAAALLVAFAYAAATDQLTFDATASAGSLTLVWAVTAITWFLGNIGFGVAIVRAKVLSVIGGWLVLAGSVAGVGMSLIPNAAPPVAVTLLFGLFGIGWIVVGYAGARSSVHPA